jgi:hypothetical protein
MVRAVVASDTGGVSVARGRRDLERLLGAQQTGCRAEGIGVQRYARSSRARGQTNRRGKESPMWSSARHATCPMGKSNCQRASYGAPERGQLKRPLPTIAGSDIDANPRRRPGSGRNRPGCRETLVSAGFGAGACAGTLYRLHCAARGLASPQDSSQRHAKGFGVAACATVWRW